MKFGVKAAGAGEEELVLRTLGAAQEEPEASGVEAIIRSISSKLQNFPSETSSRFGVGLKVPTAANTFTSSRSFGDSHRYESG